MFLGAQAPGGRSDGYEWRKYGQKSTPGVAAPRSYYKCSVAGCGAKKQARRALGRVRSRAPANKR